MFHQIQLILLLLIGAIQVNARPPMLPFSQEEAFEYSLLLESQLLINTAQTLDKKASCEVIGETQIKSCHSLSRFPYPDIDQLLKDPRSNICKPQWDFYSFTQKAVKSRSSLNDCNSAGGSRFSFEYLPKSEAQMSEKGWRKYRSTSDQEILSNWASRIGDIQKKSIKHCCGTDEICIKAMEKVRVDFCESSIDSDSPDKCSDGGFFSHNSIEEKALSLLALKPKYTRQSRRGMKGHLFPNPAQQEDEQILNSFKIKTTNGQDNVVISGGISLSTYGKALPSGDVVWFDDEETVVHELSHACTSIRSQLKLSPSELRKYYDISYDCYNENLKSYKKLITSIYEEKEDFINCMSKTVENYLQDQETLKCSHVCSKAMIEEALAELDALNSNDDILSSLSLYYGCFGYFDEFHPYSYDVMRCALQTDSLFRDRIYKNFNCKQVYGI